MKKYSLPPLAAFAGLATCGLALILSVSALHAQTLPVRTSDAFPEYLNGRSYEADSYPDLVPFSNLSSPRWWRSEPNAGATEALGPSTLILDMVDRENVTNTAPAMYYRSQGGAGGNFWLGDNDVGYTVEIRIRVEESYDPVNGAMFLAVRGGTAAGQGKVQFLHNALRFANMSDVSASQVLAEGLDNSDDFHIVRLAKTAGRNRWHVWRDGVLVGAHLEAGPHTTNEIIFGNTATARYAGKVHIDYIRWDITGAYAPNEASAELPETDPPEFHVKLRRATELSFATTQGTLYQLQTSTDGSEWRNVGRHFVGTGETMRRFYSTQEGPLFLRVLESN
jgi:hypothetical protein